MGEEGEGGRKGRGRREWEGRGEEKEDGGFGGSALPRGGGTRRFSECGHGPIWASRTGCVITALNLRAERERKRER